MTKSRLFLVLALTIVAFSVCGQQALAQHHLQARTMPGVQPAGINPDATLLLFQLIQGMGVLPPVDGGGNDAWPCFPNANANGADCSQIAAGGVVIGTPAYSWSFTNCDGNTTTSPACGQIFWFYEDDTGDNTDHLFVNITAKQGTGYVLDTGNFDFGPNPFPAGSVVVISDDVNFGTLGATGKNNGQCAGSGKTCVNPIKGVVNVSLSTKVGTSKATGKFNVDLK
jgi:hypothetical protein